ERVVDDTRVQQCTRRDMRVHRRYIPLHHTGVRVHTLPFQLRMPPRRPSTLRTAFSLLENLTRPPTHLHRLEEHVAPVTEERAIEQRPEEAHQREDRHPLTEADAYGDVRAPRRGVDELGVRTRDDPEAV